jgi:hypothetical protein
MIEVNTPFFKQDPGIISQSPVPVQIIRVYTLSDSSEVSFGVATNLEDFFWYRRLNNAI